MHSLWKHPDGVLEGGVTTSTEVSLAAVSSQANAERTTQLQHEVESLRKQAETVGDQCLCERGRGGEGALFRMLALVGIRFNAELTHSPNPPKSLLMHTMYTKHTAHAHYHTDVQTYTMHTIHSCIRTLPHIAVFCSQYCCHCIWHCLRSTSIVVCLCS